MHFKKYFEVFLLISISAISSQEDLECYSCVHVEAGNLDLIKGFENVIQHDSCKYGLGKPDDSLLVNCTVDEEPGFRYFYRCMEMRVNGKILGVEGQDSEFNGTLWGCATRREKINTENLLTKECQQGQLSEVARNFLNSEGKEFLRNMTDIFDGAATRTKTCACDFACWEEDDAGGEGTTSGSTSSPSSGSTSSSSSGSTPRNTASSANTPIPTTSGKPGDSAVSMTKASYFIIFVFMAMSIVIEKM